MFEQMCRTCLATCGELVPIFSNDYYVHNLPDKLFHTTQIEVQKDDDLPKMMCKKCIFLVDSLYCFKDQCEVAEIKLKKRLTSDNNTALMSSYKDKNSPSNIVEHSDAAISSEEYDIEYVSEEARMEVENARRKNRNGKKKHTKHSGIKVKSVKILPSETKDNIYKNLNTTPSYRYDVPEMNEDIITGDSDDKSSVYFSEESKKFNSGNVNTNDYNSYIHVSEKSEYYTNQNRGWIREKSPKVGSKRRIENDNSFNQLTKVPKKVMFKDNDYNDENMQYIEINDNQEAKLSNSMLPKVENDLDAIVQINVIEDGTGKILQNYDVPVSKNHSSMSYMNSVQSNDYTKMMSEDIDKKIVEMRLKNLIDHIVLNIPEVCAICHTYFNTYLDVLKHKIETHLKSDQEYFFCPICHEKFYINKNLVKHLNDHADVCSYICILCSGNFYTQESLRTHLQSHVDLRDLKCQMCSRKFQRIQSLLNHLEQHIGSKQLVCTLCSDHFTSKDLLQNHIDEEHKKPLEEVSTECKTCGVLVPREAVEEHTKTHTNSYPCPYCEKSYSMKTTLRDHVFTHLGVHQFTCLVCEKMFSSQEERTLHMQEHMKPQQQGDRKKFRCRVCHEILVSRVAYGQHLKAKHWNSKQTSEILKELSESSINERLNEQFNKSCTTPSASDYVSST